MTPIAQLGPLPLTHVRRGKVREVFAVGDDRLLLVATDRVSAFDVAAHAQRPVVDAQERTHRRAPACAAVAGETLDLPPLGEEGRREQVACGLCTLAAATLDDDL